MPRSRRHHYVPQFLTNGFLNSEGKITVYDKIDDRYYPGNPVNMFLETDRNTFPNLENEDDDVVERVYASFDSIFSSTLTEINNTNHISDQNFETLLFLAYVSKWRVPQYDEAFKNAKDYFSVDDLGLGFKDENDDRIPFDLEADFKMDMQQEMKRLLLAMQRFRFRDDYKKLIKNSFLLCTPIDSLIGDCPFIEATVVSDEYFEDFIFPVSKDLTLVYCARIERKEIEDFLNYGAPEKVNLFLAEFAIPRDISLLAIAGRNVACGNTDYLKSIVNRYKLFQPENEPTIFHLTVFSLLYRFKEFTGK